MNFSAIITLFHPEQDILQKNIELLLQSGWRVILMDNSPEAMTAWSDDKVCYQHLPDNLGIAAAQNIGLKIVQSYGDDYAMLLDQDSHLTSEFLSQVALRVQQAHKTFTDLAAYGPTIVSEFDLKAVKPAIQRQQTMTAGFLKARQIIASGMTIPMGVLDDIGLMDEPLFIDGVDHEWCWRAATFGFSVYVDSETQLLHKQGEDRVTVLGVTFKVGHPIRLYYQYRNILLLMRRSYVPLYWKLRNLLAMPVRWLVNRWVLEPKKQRGKYIREGLIDGLKGASGRYKAD